MTERTSTTTRIELSPELREQFGYLIATMRMLSHGALSPDDYGPMQPTGLEALTMAVDRQSEALQTGLHGVAEALSDVAQALRGEEPFWAQGPLPGGPGDELLRTLEAQAAAADPQASEDQAADPAPGSGSRAEREYP